MSTVLLNMNIDYLALLWPILMLIVLGTIIFRLSKLVSLLIRYLDLKIEYLEAKLDQMDKDQE